MISDALSMMAIIPIIIVVAIIVIGAFACLVVSCIKDFKKREYFYAIISLIVINSFLATVISIILECGFGL